MITTSATRTTSNCRPFLNKGDIQALFGGTDGSPAPGYAPTQDQDIGAFLIFYTIPDRIGPFR
jgi:hypothetical protein